MDENGFESFHARVISKGRITIPEETRIALKIKQGDLVKILIKKVKN